MGARACVRSALIGGVTHGEEVDVAGLGQVPFDLHLLEWRPGEGRRPQGKGHLLGAVGDVRAAASAAASAATRTAARAAAATAHERRLLDAGHLHEAAAAARRDVGPRVQEEAAAEAHEREATVELARAVGREPRHPLRVAPLDAARVVACGTRTTQRLDERRTEHRTHTGI